MKTTYEKLYSDIQTTLNGYSRLVDLYSNELKYNPDDYELEEKVSTFTPIISDLKKSLDSRNCKDVLKCLNYIASLFISFAADEYDMANNIFD